MYARYQPYSYQRRYYDINPYYYGRYYNPYYNYSTNVVDSQVANVDQNMVNFGDMTNVNQDSNVFQSRAEPVGLATLIIRSGEEPENVGVCTETPPTILPV
jgi:hypothetical protein